MDLHYDSKTGSTDIEPRRCVAPLAVDAVGQYVRMRSPYGGADAGRVEVAASDRGRQLVGVRWDSGRLGYVDPDRLEVEVDREHERVCGAIATVERVVEGVVCPLCQAHAAELDAEPTEAAQVAL